LHSHVARLRQALDACGLPGVLVTREPGYLLALPPERVDAARFETAARHGRDALDAADPARAVTLLREAAALWQGETALADAEPRGWAGAEVDRLAEVRLAAAEDRWEAELRLGRHAAATGELERLLVGHPLRERLVGLLMLAQYRAGRHTGALEAYRRLRARLADELGVDPGPDLVTLHTRILRQDRTLDLDSAGPGTPENTGQATPVGAGPGAPAAAWPVPPRPAQLPAPVGHFTGRDRQLAELDRLAEQPVADVRIAVISGLAGMGKTALALEWGHRVSGRFPDGQIYLDLRGHEPRSAVPASAALSHLLRAVGVPADRIPAEPSDQGALYRSLVHDRRMLILLDNAGSAEAILPLVPAGAGNLLLVTSRNPLAALTTHHAVTSVGLDPLAEADAVALLGRVLGVSRVSREPESAVDLVRLCDRMPLALRIAAAKLVAHPGGRLQALVTTLEGGDRVDALSVEGDSRSVGTVFASAYRALSPPAARLFRRLGLHPGVTLSTGLAGALVDLDPAGTARVLAELADAHLVLPAGPDRHWFHDLIAIFARHARRSTSRIRPNRWHGCSTGTWRSPMRPTGRSTPAGTGSRRCSATRHGDPVAFPVHGAHHPQPGPGVTEPFRGGEELLLCRRPQCRGLPGVGDGRLGQQPQPTVEPFHVVGVLRQDQVLEADRPVRAARARVDLHRVRERPAVIADDLTARVEDRQAEHEVPAAGPSRGARHGDRGRAEAEHEREQHQDGPYQPVAGGQCVHGCLPPGHRPA
jgi:hypothetical protein